jgi:hypothetical protein
MNRKATPDRILDESHVLSWVHLGDLHITDAQEQNYQDFRALIDEVNEHLTGENGVHFAFLPGDNADNGTEAQFQLVRRTLEGLHLPVHILPGDHDIQSGSLELFRQWLEPELPKSLIIGRYRCVFLNSVDIPGTKGFDLGPKQIAWLEDELVDAARREQNVVLFMHTYPSELDGAASLVGEMIRRFGHVRLVEMGHTHYNEIANDGRLLYAATRSTGQIEEGPVGFSVTCLDGPVVSWKFKALGTPWPLVMITSPADRALLTEISRPVKGTIEVRAKVWTEFDEGVVRATCQVDAGLPLPMTRVGKTSVWSWFWYPSHLADGTHRITVRVETARGEGVDTINVLLDRAGKFELPERHPRDMDNAIGAYPERGILGTQLGPNKNGRKW